MNVVDSSAWLEYFADRPNAEHFAPAIENVDHLIVPAIAVFEVFKRVLQQRDESAALRAVAHMLMGKVVDLDAALAIAAARLSHDLKIPLADSIILTTARHHDAILWTQDADFDGLDEVGFYPRRSG